MTTFMTGIAARDLSYTIPVALAVVGFSAISAAAAYDPDETVCSAPTASNPTLDVNLTLGSIAANNVVTINQAINAGRVHLAANPNDNYVIHIPSGTWDIGNGSTDAIVFDGLNTDIYGDEITGTGKLVFTGDTMQTTTLNFTNYKQKALKGANVRRLHICNLHLTRAEETVTQGEVVGFLEGSEWSDNLAGDPPIYPYGNEVLTTSGTLVSTRPDPTVSPGSPSFPSDTTLVVRLHTDFPTPADIYDDEVVSNPSGDHIYNCQGRFMRKYSYFSGVPYLEPNNNKHISWKYKEQLPNGDWAIGLGRPGFDYNNNNFTPTYNVGDTLAIKSKKVRDAVWFAVGRDIALENIKLTRGSRVLFRASAEDNDPTTNKEAIDEIRLTNVGVERNGPIGGKIPFISSSEGGPQFIGQLGSVSNPPNDPDVTGPCVTSAPNRPPAISGGDMTNVLIEDSQIVATGDDAIGIFNVSGLEVQRTRIEDSFGRGIFVGFESTTPCLQNFFERSPVFLNDGSTPPFGCTDVAGTLPTPPTHPTEPVATAFSGRVKLQWDHITSPPADFRGYEIRRRLEASCPLSPGDPFEDGVAEVVTTGIAASTMATTAYNDISTDTGEIYQYFIFARDDNFNLSTTPLISSCVTAL